MISSGSNFNCAINNKGKLKCWMMHNRPNTHFIFVDIPPEVKKSKIKYVTTGDERICSINSAKIPFCWKYNLHADTNLTSVLLIDKNGDVSKTG